MNVLWQKQRIHYLPKSLSQMNVNTFIKHLTKPKKFPIQLNPSFSSSLSSLNFQDSTQSQPFNKKALKLIDSCYTLNHLYQIHAHFLISGLFKSLTFSSRVLKRSSELCELDYTLLVFRYMTSYDAFCVNTMIKAYSCSSMPQKAVVFYFEMLKNGFFPNSFSFPPLISACVKMGSVKMGQICHGQVVKNGIDGVLQVQNALLHLYGFLGLMDGAREVFDEMSVRDMITWNTVIDGFVKGGEISVAHKLFDAMPEKNVVLWNIMITGYLKHGNPGNGLKLFRKMMEMGCKGNHVTIVNAITACSRSARLKEGKSVHAWLIRRHANLSVIIKTSLIYMYCRCQRVDIAQLIFDEIRIRTLVCWNAMILGNCIHGNALAGVSLFIDMIADRRREKRVLPDAITFIGVLCACAREGLLIQGRKLFSLMEDAFNIKANFAHCWCMANLYAKVGLLQEAVGVLRDIKLDEDALPESSLFAGLFTSVRFHGNVNLGEKIAKELIEQDPLNFSYYALLVNVYAVSGRWEEVTQTKDLMKSKGILKVPGCGLKDLQEVVQNTKVEEEWQSREDVLALLQTCS